MRVVKCIELCKGEMFNERFKCIMPVPSAAITGVIRRDATSK
jgi:hypothetical protein